MLHLTDLRHEQPRTLRRLYVCHSYIFRHMRSDILFYCTEYSTCFQNRSARESISTEDYQDDIESFADSGIQAQGLLVVGQRHGRVSHQRHFGAAASRFPIRRQGYPVDNFRNLMISQITSKLGNCSCRLCLNKEPLSPCTLVM